MTTHELILYVSDQGRARAFWTAVLDLPVTLDVPGMTEIDLGGVTLGLMPGADMAELVPGIDAPGRGQRCEVYLRRADAAEVLARVGVAGGRVLAPIAPRGWGESVGYALDPDGHVLAVAVASTDLDGTSDA